MDKSMLELGQVVSTHGIQGELKIIPWADTPEFLKNFKTFMIGTKTYTVQSMRIHKGCVLAKVEGIETPEQGMLLRSQTVYGMRNEVELPEGTVFIRDLIGCDALDDNGVKFGTVKDVMTMPSNDVYVIRGKKEYMIPSVKEFVKEINVDEGYIRVHLIEGMATDEN